MSDTKSLIFTQRNINTSNKDQMVLSFPQKLHIDNDEEVCLLNCFINYSWKNLTNVFNNNTVSYTWGPTGATTYPVNFGEVFFLVSDISNYIQQVMLSNGHYLVNDVGVNVFYIEMIANYTVYGLTLICTPLPSSLPLNWTNPAGVVLSAPNAITPQLVFNSNNFNDIVGFNKNTAYPASPSTTTVLTNSINIPQLTPNAGCLITTNIVNSPNYNTYGNVIATFTPNVTFGSQIIIQPTQSIWYSALSGTYSSLVIDFYDSNMNKLGILDSNILLTLMIRKKRKYIE